MPPLLYFYEFCRKLFKIQRSGMKTNHLGQNRSRSENCNKMEVVGNFYLGSEFSTKNCLCTFAGRRWEGKELFRAVPSFP